MKKIETIWHHILNSALQGECKHTQQHLAHIYNFSLSTVHHAVQVPSKIGALRKTTKFFVLEDFDKLLYYWASMRHLEKDLVYTTYYPGRITQAETEVPAESVYAGYTAGRMLLGEAPADYNKLYCYYDDVVNFMQRFPPNNKRDPNIYMLKKSPYMPKNITTLPQTFVDIWNMREWFSKDFTRNLEESMHGILS